MSKLHPEQHVILIDPPTFPKGVLSLGLASVAAALPDGLKTTLIDLNVSKLETLTSQPEFLNSALYVGLKVSCQNFRIAAEISDQIRKTSPGVRILWGGEFPTLLPDEAAQYCDSVVLGSFEPVANTLLRDLERDCLNARYDGRGKYKLSDAQTPDVRNYRAFGEFYSFMGVPVETSRGCDRRCVFCMVHVMQNKGDLKPLEVLRAELANYSGQFVNVVDYNVAVNREHVIGVAKAFEESDTIGWMAELCLQSLDDDELLEALQKSRCRLVYCGLESLDQQSLKSVNKGTTNQRHDYERIIRKAQSYNVQIGAGLILGIEGMSKDSFDQTLRKFDNWGIAYTKLTFLTYNPGTKVHRAMKKKGGYLTDAIEAHDGNHLTFLANGVDEEVVIDGTKSFIQSFYGFRSILRRSENSQLTGLRRLEFVLFNLGYRMAYFDWLECDVLGGDKPFDELLRSPFKKSWKIRRIEQLLRMTRKHIHRTEAR